MAGEDVTARVVVFEHRVAVEPWVNIGARFLDPSDSFLSILLEGFSYGPFKKHEK